MRILFMMLMVLCAAAGMAHADVVHLKNGKVIEGKILEKTPDSVKVDINGVTLTYYADEISSIEGGPQAVEPVAQAAATPVPAASAPVVQVPVVPPAPVVPQVPVVSPAPVVSAPVVQAPAVAPAPVVSAPVTPTPVAPEAAAAKDELDGMSKEALIIKFVEIYGVKENMQMNFDKMMANLKPDQVEAFRGSIKVDEIVKEIIPIYDKYFSAEDLRVYIRFYMSSAGKNLAKMMPLLVQDSVDVSVKYLETHLPDSLKQ